MAPWFPDRRWIGREATFFDTEIEEDASWVFDEKMWEAEHQFGDHHRYAEAVFRARPREDTCLRYTAMIKAYRQIPDAVPLTNGHPPPPPRPTEPIRVETHEQLPDAIQEYLENVLTHLENHCGCSLAFWDLRSHLQTERMDVPGGFALLVFLACEAGLSIPLDRSTAMSNIRACEKMHTTPGPERVAGCFAEFIRAQQTNRDA